MAWTSLTFGAIAAQHALLALGYYLPTQTDAQTVPILLPQMLVLR